MRTTRMCKRFLASILTVCMLFAIVPQQVLAAMTETIAFKTQEKEAILQELQAITGDEEEAQALYYRMNALGLFDDEGNWVTEELMIDGNIFTLQEAKMVLEQMDDNELVTVGNVTISVKDLKIMIEIEEEIARIKETYFSGEDWTTQELNSIESLQQSLNNGDFLVQQSQVGGDPEVGPSGVNHWLRVSIDVSKAIINETEGVIDVPVRLSRLAKQRVSFKWRSKMDGGAVDSGTVYIEPGLVTGWITMALPEIHSSLMGKQAILLNVYDLTCGEHNALFTNGYSSATYAVHTQYVEKEYIKNKALKLNVDGTKTTVIKEQSEFYETIEFKYDHEPMHPIEADIMHRSVPQVTVSGELYDSMYRTALQATVSEEVYSPITDSMTTGSAINPRISDSSWVDLTAGRNNEIVCRIKDGVIETQKLSMSYNGYDQPHFRIIHGKRVDGIYIFNHLNIPPQEHKIYYNLQWEDHSVAEVTHYYAEEHTLGSKAVSTGLSVPITMRFSKPVDSENTRVKINGKILRPMEKDTMSSYLLFAYPIDDVEPPSLPFFTGYAKVVGIDYMGIPFEQMLEKREWDTEIKADTMLPEYSLASIKTEDISALEEKLPVDVTVKDEYMDLFASKGYKIYGSTDGGITKTELNLSSWGFADGEIHVGPNLTDEAKAGKVEIYVGQTEETAQLYVGLLAQYIQQPPVYINTSDFYLVTEPNQLPSTVYFDDNPDILYVKHMNGVSAAYTWGNDFTWDTEVYVNDEWTTEGADAVATLAEIEDGKQKLVLGGKSGRVRVTLTANNGGVPGKAAKLETQAINVKVGSTPVLKINELLKKISVRRGEDAIFRWTSNFTENNYQKLVDRGMSESEASASTMPFKIEVFEHVNSNYHRTETAPSLSDTSVWTLHDSMVVDSSRDNTISNYPLKGLDSVSVVGGYSYAVKISATWEGRQYQDYAYIKVGEKPAIIALDEPKLYYTEEIAKEGIPLTWSIKHFDTVNTDHAQFELIITNNSTGEKIIYGNDILIPADGCATGEYTLNPDSVTGRSGRNIYTVEVRARNSLDSTWSYDSAVLYIYNDEAFQIYVDGVKAQDHFIMSNEKTISEMSRDEILELNRNIALTNKIGINPNVPWDNISDQVVWESSNPESATINYRCGTLYEDIRNLDYISFNPKTEFILSGLENGSTQISANHRIAPDILLDTLDVSVETLKDKLYLFQVYPASSKDNATVLEYVNGYGEKRQIFADETGSAAVYEESGIIGPVAVKSEVDGKTYVGTFRSGTLETGEKDSTNLQLYPLNTLKLREVATAQLFLKDENGKPYANKEFTLRAGVYKNDVYVEQAKFAVTSDGAVSNAGNQDIIATTDEEGKLTVFMDVMQFYTNEEKGEDRELTPNDQLEFIFEVQFHEDGTKYYPQLIAVDGMLSTSETVHFGENVILLRPNTQSKKHPYIVRQEADFGEAGKVNVLGNTGKVGPGQMYPKVSLETTVYWWGQDNVDEESIYYRDKSGIQAPIQQADNIKYPFTAIPMTFSTMALDEKGLEGWLNTGISKSLELCYIDSKGDMIQTEPQSFQVVNMIGMTPPHEDDAAKENMNQLMGSLMEQLGRKPENVGGVGIGDALLGAGFSMIGNTGFDTDSVALSLFSTGDPTVFHGLFKVGFGGAHREIEVEEGISTEYMSIVKNIISPDERKVTETDLKDAVNSVKELGKDMIGADFNYEVGGYIMSEIYWDDEAGKWTIHVLSGGVNGGAGMEYMWRINSYVGPIPVTTEVGIGGAASIELNVGINRQDDINYYLTQIRISAYMRAFGGFGFDYSIIALKIGLFGEVNLDFRARWLNSEGDYNGVGYPNMKGQRFNVFGRVGIEFYACFLFISYRNVLASQPFDFNGTNFGQWSDIDKAWKEVGEGKSNTGGIIGPSTFNTMYYDERTGQSLYLSETVATMESRDYLTDFADREWNPLRISLFALDTGENSGIHSTWQNAYPGATPAVTDDGKIMVYLDDGDSTDITKTRVAVSMLGVDDKFSEGVVIDDAGFGDSQIDLAGTSDFAVSAWTRQRIDIEKKAGEPITENDQVAMINSAEIMVSIYDESSWHTTAITDNETPDLAPAVAAKNGKAIVAWRSVKASDISQVTRFDAEDSILYKTYENGSWSEAKTLYNGTSGAVKGMEVAMMEDGTASIVYTIDTNDKPLAQDTVATRMNTVNNTGYEIIYSIVDDLSQATNRRTLGENRATASNIRLTFDGYLDENPQITTAHIKDQEHFIIGWSRTVGNSSNQRTMQNEPRDVDLSLRAIDAEGKINVDIPDSISQMAQGQTVKVTPTFRFAKGAKNFSDLSIVWVEPISTLEEKVGTDGTMTLDKDRLVSVKVVEHKDKIGDVIGYGITVPMEVAEMGDHTTIDHFDVYIRDNQSNLRGVILGSDYGTQTYEAVTNQQGQVMTITDENGQQEPIIVAKPKSSLYTATGTYENTVSIDETNFDYSSVVPGFSLPIQMMVTNTGMNPITELTISFGGEEVRRIGDISLEPAQSLPITVTYKIPSQAKEIRNEEMIVTATFNTNETAKDKEILEFAMTDIGISRLELVDKVEGKRMMQVTLYNGSEVPLKAEEHIIKLGLYSDAEGTQALIEPIQIEEKDYGLINAGGYATQFIFDIGSYVKNTLKEQEIPEGGMQIYARVWIEEATVTKEKVLETVDANNIISCSILSLQEEQDGEVVSIYHQLNNDETGASVDVTVQNNRLSDTSTGNIIVTLLDEKGQVLEQKQSYRENATGNGLITLKGEEKVKGKFAFDQTGASVMVAYSDLILNVPSADLTQLKFQGIDVTLKDFKETAPGIYEHSITADDLTETIVTATTKSSTAKATVTATIATRSVDEGSHALVKNIVLIPGEYNEITVQVVDGELTKTYILKIQNNGAPVIPGPDDEVENPPQYSASVVYGGDQSAIVRVNATAKPDNGYNIGYQWYRCDVDGSNEEIMVGETKPELSISSNKDTGTYYYKCEIIRSLINGENKTYWSSVATVQINQADGNAVLLEGTIVDYDGRSHGLTRAEAIKEGSTLYYSIDAGVTWSQIAPTFTARGVHTIWVKAAHMNYTETDVVTADVVINKQQSSDNLAYVTTIKKTENGTVSISPKIAVQGKEIVITPKPVQGYEVNSVMVKSKDGSVIDIQQKSNGSYTFIMPKGGVSVEVTFRLSQQFADISSSQWYYESVDYVVREGLMVGIDDKTFSPNGIATRGTIVTMLHRLEGTPRVNRNLSFTDVEKDGWYVEGVRWAVDAGIVKGMSDDIFNPNTPITREQLAVMLYNYAQYKGLDTHQREDIAYPDKQMIAPWALDAAGYMQAKGSIKGDEKGNFNPKQNATRAEIAAVFMRFIEEM